MTVLVFMEVLAAAATEIRCFTLVIGLGSDNRLRLWECILNLL